MSLTPAERAALTALLKRVRASKRLLNSDDLLRPFLTDEQFARFKALKSRLSAPFVERLASLPEVRVPASVNSYRSALGTAKKDYEVRETDLVKMRGQLIALKQTIARYEEFLATAKDGSWRRYNAFSELEKDWCEETGDDGWPPKVIDAPPMSALFPGEEAPVIVAARTILTEALEGSVDDQ